MVLGNQKEFGNKKPPTQLIVMGCPGSGKSHKLKDFATGENIKQFRTTFHPELSYGDFVGSYKPVPIYIKSANASFDASGKEIKDVFQDRIPVVKYEFRPGPFINAYIEAKLNSKYDVILIIEEINRANPAAVFGDILQLLDRDANEESEYDIDTLPDLSNYLSSKKIERPEKLKLPSNLFIWGTMNRADESVNYVDSAFLRRWSLHYLSYDEKSVYDDQVTYFAGKNMKWEEVRLMINNMLKNMKETDIEDDKFIGPYFMKKNELQDKAKMFSKLITYLWYDVVPMERDSVFVKKTLSDLYKAWIDGEQIFK